ncbi:MAG: adenylate/guanylate cyclase domain-containing protein [Thaumarchaeota archaeon]|nr:adenylate/guanylate cyclase domain-containing protein [Nitrososphaerota archaeon]
MSTLEGRRLAAIMFTDIVGYTAQAQVNEARALQTLGQHRTILRSIFPRYEGKEVKTVGDAFLIEFPSALEAVRCSIEIQQAMHDRNLSVGSDQSVQLRVGKEQARPPHGETRGEDTKERQSAH